ncbi:hypothetical protein FRC02_008215 [Tulasnella sp. 418]|nr:hypothetical protein FRC02_008215 [Tulasnella sp. 418]
MERNVDFVRIIILKPKIVDGKPEPLPQSNVGICRLVMFLSGSNKHRHTTNTYKHSVSPVLESATKFSVPIKKASAVIIKVIRGSRLWQGSYDRLKNATDLKNVEATLGGKSDPYVRVLLNGVIKSGTDAADNAPNGIGLSMYPFTRSENLIKDRSPGTVELKCTDLAREDPENKEYPYASTGRQLCKERVELDKGTPESEPAFVPSLNFKGSEFHEKNELEKAVDKGNHSGDDSDSDVPSGVEESVSSSDEEHHEVLEL